MGVFFIETQTGQVATAQQLAEAGIAARGELPPRPWHRIRGSGDATTLWYAVLRKRTHGVFIGSMVFRHSDHHASLLRDGWEEVDVAEIRATFLPEGEQAPDDPYQRGPWGDATSPQAM